MPPRRTSPPPRLADLHRCFPDRDSFEQFQDELHRIEKRRGVKREEIISILLGAWFHARLYKIKHQALDRTNWLERSERVNALLVQLSSEVRSLLEPLPAVATFAALNARPLIIRAKGTSVRLTHGVARLKKGDRIERAFEEFYRALAAVIQPIAANLRRAEGHQPQSWISVAMRDLRAAGLTKFEAETMLRRMHLKGSESAEAALQTIPRR